MAERTLTGKLCPEISFSGSLNKGVGMGALPEAAGLSVFASPAYTVSGAELTAVSQTIAQKTGVEAPVWPEGFREAVEELPQWYQTRTGVWYTPVYNSGNGTFNANSAPSNVLRYADHLIQATFPQWTSVHGGANHNPVSNSSVQRLYFPALKTNSTYIGENCLSLREVQLGSMGNPVSSVYFNAFYGCTQEELTITVYVAEGTAVPISGSPFGAANATVIYRNSATGEVITE